MAKTLDDIYSPTYNPLEINLKTALYLRENSIWFYMTIKLPIEDVDTIYGECPRQVGNKYDTTNYRIPLYFYVNDDSGIPIMGDFPILLNRQQALKDSQGKYVFQDVIFSIPTVNTKDDTVYVNNTKLYDYLYTKTDLGVDIYFKYYLNPSDETKYKTKKISLEKLYYRSTYINNNTCVVPLPKEGWERGKYTFECIYPENLNYMESCKTATLGYQSWNEDVNITCTSADEEGIIRINNSSSSDILFEVVHEKMVDGLLVKEPVKSGDITISYEDINTMILSEDMVIGQNTGPHQLNYAVQTTSVIPQQVNTGDITVDMKNTSINVEGILNDKRYWDGVNTSTDYVVSDYTENRRGMGKNYITYWNQFALIQSFTDVTIHSYITYSNNFGVGLLNPNSTLKEPLVELIYNYDEEVFTFETDTITKEIPVQDATIGFNQINATFTSEGYIYFTLTHSSDNTIEDQQIDVGLIQNSSKESYCMYYETYDDLDSVIINAITGTYGV